MRSNYYLVVWVLWSMSGIDLGWKSQDSPTISWPGFEFQTLIYRSICQWKGHSSSLAYSVGLTQIMCIPKMKWKFSLKSVQKHFRFKNFETGKSFSKRLEHNASNILPYNAEHDIPADSLYVPHIAGASFHSAFKKLSLNHSFVRGKFYSINSYSTLFNLLILRRAFFRPTLSERERERECLTKDIVCFNDLCDLPSSNWNHVLSFVQHF